MVRDHRPQELPVRDQRLLLDERKEQNPRNDAGDDKDSIQLLVLYMLDINSSSMTTIGAVISPAM